MIIRGNNIKYLRIPEEVIDMVPEEDLSKTGGKSGKGKGGRGDGRGGRGDSRGGGRSSGGRGTGRAQGRGRGY